MITLPPNVKPIVYPPLETIVEYAKGFHNYYMLKQKLDKLTMWTPNLRIHTGSNKLPGVHWAERWAFANWWPVARHELRWYEDYKEQHEDMVKSADALVVFTNCTDKKIWDLVKRANNYELKVRIFDYEE